MRILLVEDERHVRVALARALTAHGHVVVECSDGGIALDALNADASDPLDLLVLDLNLPDTTGWEILRRLGADQRGTIPTVVMSAVRPSSTRLREFQPDAVLLKPFPIDALIRAVERAGAATSSSER